MNPVGESVPPFEFATAARIVFGTGRVRDLGVLAREFGSRVLIVTGSRPERAQPAVDSLTASGLEVHRFSVRGEPTLEQVRAGTRFAREHGSQVIVGFGGGSAIDAAKAIAGLVPNAEDPLEYLEVIGRARPLSVAPRPWIAVPTTSGAGAEVTRNAVIASPEHRFKASLRSPLLLARVAIVDPELTLSLPPAETAATGLDALTQLIEPFLCNRSNPLVDAFCRDGIRRCARSLPVACRDGTDLAARCDLSLAALLGGLALANAGLGAVHGLAAPIGGAFPQAPHGAVCAALLPHALRINLRALRERAPQAPSLDRFREIATLLTGQATATAEQAIHAVAALTQALHIPRLGAMGVGPEAFDELATKAAGASSMKANPVPLTHAEIREILDSAA